MKKQYPEVLRVETFFGRFPDAIEFEDVVSATQYLLHHHNGGDNSNQVYTEVEAEDKFYYCKGFRWVNRTGRYAIASDARYVPMFLESVKNRGLDSSVGYKHASEMLQTALSIDASLQTINTQKE